MILRPREPGVGMRPTELEGPSGIGQHPHSVRVQIGGEQRMDDVLAQIGEAGAFRCRCPAGAGWRSRTVSIRTEAFPSS